MRAGFFEFDVVSDDADDVRLLLERFFEGVGGHGQRETSIVRLGEFERKDNCSFRVVGKVWKTGICL